jgi:hypothetical protein
MRVWTKPWASTVDNDMYDIPVYLYDFLDWMHIEPRRMDVNILFSPTEYPWMFATLQHLRISFRCVYQRHMRAPPKVHTVTIDDWLCQVDDDPNDATLSLQWISARSLILILSGAHPVECARVHALLREMSDLRTLELQCLSNQSQSISIPQSTMSHLQILILNGYSMVAFPSPDTWSLPLALCELRIGYRARLGIGNKPDEHTTQTMVRALIAEAPRLHTLILDCPVPATDPRTTE